MTYALVAAAIIVGIFGTILPIIPGVWLAWAATLAFGIAEGFGALGVVAFIVITGLAIWGTYLGFRIPQRQSADDGLRIVEQLLAAVLGIIGMFVIPVVGLPIGFAVGVFLLRWRSTADVTQAMASTKRILKAMVKASAAQCGCAIGILIVWGVWAIVG